MENSGATWNNFYVAWQKEKPGSLKRFKPFKLRGLCFEMTINPYFVRSAEKKKGEKAEKNFTEDILRKVKLKVRYYNSSR